MEISFSSKINNYFKNDFVLKSLQITKSSFLPFWQDFINTLKTSQWRDFVRNLNISLFNLKIKSEILSDKSLEGVSNLLTSISSNQNILQTAMSSTNTKNGIYKIISAKVQEITGDDNAGDYSELEGVWGEITIQGQKIKIGEPKYAIEYTGGGNDTLVSIVRKIKQKVPDVEVHIINNRLLISSFKEINFIDNTYGGKTDGLQLRISPQREIEQILSNFREEHFFPANYATTQKYISYKISDITNNPSATSQTPLYGIQGNITINNIVFGINTGGIIDTAESIVSKINSVHNLGAVAEIIDDRISIKSNDIEKELTILDETKYGYTDGLGLNRAEGERRIDTSTSLSYANYNINIIGLAKRQKNISFSAVDITGNSSADENTPLGLSGNLTINNTKIYLIPSQSLQDIAKIINTLQSEVKAEISNKSLTLENISQNTVYFKITDNSSGGLLGGLGIGKPTTEVRSLPAKIITGNISADENTPLNISGTLKINNVVFNIGREYLINTLSEIKDRINSTFNLGVTANIEDNTLIIRSNSTTPIEFYDNTEGGFAGTNGALGLYFAGQQLVVIPQNAVFSVDDKVYSYPTNFTQDGTPLLNFILKSPISDAEDLVSTQITTLDNINNIKENIIGLIEEYNSILNTISSFSNLSIYKTKDKDISIPNKILYNLQTKLEEIFTDKKQELEKVGFKFDDKNRITIDERKFIENLEKRLLHILNIFNSEEVGITSKINDLFKEITYGGDIPYIPPPYKERIYFSADSLFTAKGNLLNLSI